MIQQKVLTDIEKSQSAQLRQDVQLLQRFGLTVLHLLKQNMLSNTI